MVRRMSATIGVVALRRDCEQLQEFEQPAATDTLPRDGDISMCRFGLQIPDVSA